MDPMSREQGKELKIGDYAIRLEGMRRERDSQDQLIAVLSKDNERLRAQVEALEKQVEFFSEQHGSAMESVGKLSDEIDALTAERDALRAQLAERDELILQLRDR